MVVLIIEFANQAGNVTVKEGLTPIIHVPAGGPPPAPFYQAVYSKPQSGGLCQLVNHPISDSESYFPCYYPGLKGMQALVLSARPHSRKLSGLTRARGLTRTRVNDSGNEGGLGSDIWWLR